MISPIVAASPRNLRSQLALLDLTVAPRSMGRTTEQTERFALAHFLASLPRDRLAFPVTVTHSDRPDLVLDTAAGSIGVEITEAVPQNVAHKAAIRESGIGPNIHFVEHATPGEPKRSASVLIQEIKRDAPGEPWVGNAPENEWAAAMLSFVTAKRDKALKPGFALHDKNWLLVYDNWPLPHIHHEEAAEILAASCESAGVFNTFDRVFVLDSTCLCELGGEIVLYDARSPSASV